jgi:RNA polymerase sigma-70 factor, ECF subfamily
MGALLAISVEYLPNSTHWQTATDAALLEASARQNQQAFAVLMGRYYKDVYRVVWRLNGGHVDTDDVTQETFLKLWANPAQIREAPALKGWLLRVGSNLVMDRYRQKPMAEIEAADNVEDNALAAPAIMDQNFVSKTIDTAIASLPDRQKLALTLVHFEQMTNITAASTMAISVDALESLLSRARRALKEKLGPQGKMLLAAVEQGQ